MHADLDDDGSADGEGEAAGFGEERAAEHGEQDEGGGSHAEHGEVVEDFAGILQEKDECQKHQSGEGGFARHTVHLACGGGEEVAAEDAEQERREQEHEVLDDEFAYGEADGHAGLVGDESHDKFHDDRQGEQCDDAAAGCEGDGERHVALGEHGKYVGGASARTAGDEH